MLRQIRALRKRLPAHAALERLVPVVRALVDRERAHDRERLPAAGVVALVGPLARVAAHVLRERRRLAEVLPALAAGEGPVAGVGLREGQGGDSKEMV